MENKKDKDLSEAHLDKLIHQAWHKPVKPNSKKLWQRIDKSIKAPHHVMWKSIAAIFVIALLTVASLSLFNPDNPSVLVEVNNTGKTPKEILLEDGSKVLLNRNSAITYTTENSRMLTLKGEAYFDIKKDENHPFRINTGELHLTVLGTSFNVNAYENSQEILVSLVEGKLKVTANQNQEKNLSPGDELIYNKATKRISLNNFNTNTVLAWKSSLIKCENASLDFLLDRLENYYAIAIKNKADYSNCKISGEFKSDLSLDEIIEIISFSYNIDFVALSEHEYKIEGKMCD